MDFKKCLRAARAVRTAAAPLSPRSCAAANASWASTRDEVTHHMTHALEIMRTSRHDAAQNARQVHGRTDRRRSEKARAARCKGPLDLRRCAAQRAQYAMAVLEVNASMGLIVAAPTAGSAGVLPGMLFALQDCYSISDERLIDALFNAGAIGYLAMRNATVAGAVGGCQAEVGVASAMAASAAVELMGGSPEQCLDAASTVLMNARSGLRSGRRTGRVSVPEPQRGRCSQRARCRRAVARRHPPVHPVRRDARRCMPSAAASPSSCARPPSAAALPHRPPAKSADCAHKQDHI